MADRRPAARMQLVEVEDAPTPTSPSRAADNEMHPVQAAETSRPPAGVLRHWWPVAVLVVLAIVVSSLVASARDRAFVARMAAVPGMVRPLDSAPVPLWETLASPLPGTLLAADGALVVLGADDEGWTVTAHDPTTGAERWSTVVAQASRAGFESTAAVCPALREDVGSLVVCLVQLPRVLYSDDSSIQEPPRVAVVPLSAEDGSRLGGWEVRGVIVGFDRVEDDLVVGTLDSEGRLTVQRRDGRSGDVVWSMVTPVVMESAATVTAAAMRVLPPVVVLEGGATIVLDVDDGSTIMTAARFSGLQVAPLGERFATWAPVGGGHVHGVGGTALYAVSGLPAELSADDGSLAGSLLVDEGPEVAALDLATGAERWRVRSMLDPRVLVSHHLVVSGGSTYGVLDATDGSMLWEVDTSAVLPWSPLSDGSLVLGPGTSADGGPELWGRGLDDGARYWSVPLPEGVRWVDSVGGHLVVRTENTLTVYG
ncbi:PQQ-binding-like beta-propeller repeat protein [Cellulomonas humilata]|uniref:PQQ-binding-like beta-propeller repeat protein n=1 Tax=Cellulomonas humilata TaxID=144055 RepID=A0A7Y5ZYY2_9CELL|nr:PQQ-binding-like beta-propeller repeat protein [Cellulomonas humilata]NUU16694.1 PQQ-binding-like beta-propeller repeat protein [Cellulomonas humilata]